MRQTADREKAWEIKKSSKVIFVKKERLSRNEEMTAKMNRRKENQEPEGYVPDLESLKLVGWRKATCSVLGEEELKLYAEMIWGTGIIPKRTWSSLRKLKTEGTRGFNEGDPYGAHGQQHAGNGSPQRT